MTPRTLATRLIDAWTAECRKPGAHTFEDVAVPLLEEWRRGWPPSEVPVFTGDWVRHNFPIGGEFNKNCELIADAINTRLTTFRLAPASEPDLERMQEALTRAFGKWMADRTGCAFAIGTSKPPNGAKFLAAEGFRLGDAPWRPLGYFFQNPDSGIEFSEQHPVESGEIPDASDIAEATPKLMTDYLKIAWSENEDLRAKLNDETAIQSRIDAAERAEREAIAADCEARMQAERIMRDMERRANRPDMATMYEDRAQAYTEILAAIRARTTNPEVAAPTEAPVAKEDVSLSDVSTAGESPAPHRRVVKNEVCNDGSVWYFEELKYIHPSPSPEKRHDPRRGPPPGD